MELAVRQRRSDLVIIYACWLLAIAHVVVVRLCWSEIPLQTDNGIWAYNGWQLLEGAVPYRDLWDNKPPGVFLLFAGVQAIFGSYSETALLWMDGVVSLAVLVVAFAVARRFSDARSASFAILLLSLVFCHRVLADWGNNLEKFVALFDGLGLLVFLRLKQSEFRGGGWIGLGMLCGGAMVFKQTGVLFLLCLAGWLIWQSRRGIFTALQVRRWLMMLVVGAAVVWLPVLVWLGSQGALSDFWRQAVLYDLVRAGSGGPERSRLFDIAHWKNVLHTILLGTLLLGYSIFAIIYWCKKRKTPILPSSETVTLSHALSPILKLVILYWGAALLVFLLAPYGFGHYLLQSLLPATVLVAWLYAQLVSSQRSASGENYFFWWIIVFCIGFSGIYEHLIFTFDQQSQHRQAFLQLGDKTLSLADNLRQNSDADQSVMLWPPDYPVSWRAQRRTPLEFSNIFVIDMGRSHRLDPPMDAIQKRLQADPPDVIVDTTAVKVIYDKATSQPQLAVKGALGLLEAPDDQHPQVEGRATAPLKRWVREHYGGQRRIGQVIFFYKGEKWREWGEFMSDESPGGLELFKAGD